ncbi:CoA transferase [Saccharothrix algeriensis]|uniref:Crotonobetainyl-CoA:carnitine CoA-transferase CaiB-like acyl-CoA transferase n=2 Tax=Saccharothrix algeriensis TaxID=173560 RepID=A0ABS2RZC3_9PSEU|nr:CoA transferase [Saccharothrix algeriensis]MBM7809341.1 crotonobetainyl-CoA:carnitine CoA-transferase CaiB-like acyl-CoA transferase [Saccharothrix algeriensis]
MVDGDDDATAQAWAALGGPAPLAAGVEYEVVRGVLAARLPVRRLARASVGVCSLAAAELLAARNGGPAPAVRVHEGAVATAFASERHLRVDGRAPTAFAPLSRFWRTADGWVRTHANYPHHRARLLAATGVPDRGDDAALVERLAAGFAARPAEAVQEAVHAAGGLAVAVRPGPPERHPLVEWRAAGGARAPLPAAGLPAAGVRVLDLTRVIAGPVGTRVLALLGADVLRVDPPEPAEDDDFLADTGLGKRSAVLDLARDRRLLDDLLETADVVVTGYRPGALDRYGLAPDALLDRRPGLVVAQLCAWGWTGPWAGRRGFDSLVQAGSGIAVAEGDGDRPGALPVQALDHGTGYLLAAAVLRALTGRQRDGGGRHVRLSLAGTASWLVNDLAAGADGSEVDGPAAGGAGQEPAHDPSAWVAERDSPHGLLRHALPPVRYAGAPATWSRPASRWDADRPEWVDR